MEQYFVYSKVLIEFIYKLENPRVSKFYGNILATENQQAIINNVIEVKMGVYLYKT